jgi:hypothetical protein
MAASLRGAWSAVRKNSVPAIIADEDMLAVLNRRYWRRRERLFIRIELSIASTAAVMIPQGTPNMIMFVREIVSPMEIFEFVAGIFTANELETSVSSRSRSQL